MTGGIALALLLVSSAPVSSVTEPLESIRKPARAMFVVALIYAFLVGVSSLESGIKIMGEDTTERLFSAAGNPIAALCIGILGTILVQSSSASTSIIVGLVATGKLGVVALANTLLTVSSMDWALAEKLLRQRVTKAPMCLLFIWCLLNVCFACMPIHTGSTCVKLNLLRSNNTFVNNYK